MTNLLPGFINFEDAYHLSGISTMEQAIAELARLNIRWDTAVEPQKPISFPRSIGDILKGRKKLTLPNTVRFLSRGEVVANFTAAYRDMTIYGHTWRMDPLEAAKQKVIRTSRQKTTPDSEGPSP